MCTEIIQIGNITRNTEIKKKRQKVREKERQRKLERNRGRESQKIGRNSERKNEDNKKE